MAEQLLPTLSNLHGDSRDILQDAWDGEAGACSGKYVDMLDENLKANAPLGQLLKMIQDKTKSSKAAHGISLEDIMGIAEVSKDQLSEFVSDTCAQDSRCGDFVEEVMAVVQMALTKSALELDKQLRAEELTYISKALKEVKQLESKDIIIKYGRKGLVEELKSISSAADNQHKIAVPDRIQFANIVMTIVMEKRLRMQAPQKHVEKWLRSIEMECYYAKFIEKGYHSLVTAVNLSRDNLEAMDISSAHCDELLVAMSQHEANAVRQVLVSSHMERYSATFARAGCYTVESLSKVSRADLKKMGVLSGHAKKLTGLFKRFAKKLSPKERAKQLKKWLKSLGPDMEGLADTFVEHGWSCDGNDGAPDVSRQDLIDMGLSQNHIQRIMAKFASMGRGDKRGGQVKIVFPTDEEKAAITRIDAGTKFMGEAMAKFNERFGKLEQNRDACLTKLNELCEELKQRIDAKKGVLSAEITTAYQFHRSALTHRRKASEQCVVAVQTFAAYNAFFADNSLGPSERKAKFDASEAGVVAEQTKMKALLAEEEKVLYEMAVELNKNMMCPVCCGKWQFHGELFSAEGLTLKNANIPAFPALSLSKEGTVLKWQAPNLGFDYDAKECETTIAYKITYGKPDDDEKSLTAIDVAAGEKSMVYDMAQHVPCKAKVQYIINGVLQSPLSGFVTVVLPALQPTKDGTVLKWTAPDLGSNSDALNIAYKILYCREGSENDLTSIAIAGRASGYDMKQFAPCKAKVLYTVNGTQSPHSAFVTIPRPGPTAEELRQKKEMEARLAAQKAKQAKKGVGALAISLMWDHSDSSRKNDLDLYVTCPSGEVISYKMKKSKCGGELDVDMQKSASKPVENIVWTKNAPKGTYKIRVHNCSTNHKSNVRFQVGINIDGETEMLNQVVAAASGSWKDVKTFNL